MVTFSLSYIYGSLMLGFPSPYKVHSQTPSTDHRLALKITQVDLTDPMNQVDGDSRLGL
jgi:hypothetical protein